MLFHYYVAESLWRDEQQALEKRIRRGDFIDRDHEPDKVAPKISFFRKWLSSRKKKANPQL